MRVPSIGVRLGMAWTHGNTPETEPPRQFANTAFVQFNSERSRDAFTQINQTPADDPIGLGVRAGPHPRLEPGFLLN